MKLVKYVLVPILAILLIYILLCLAGPKNMDVTKSTDINAPAGVVFNLCNNLSATEKWNSWTINDTTIEATYGDVASGVGATSSWTSDLTGNGSQKIIESTNNEKVRSELIFEGFGGSNYAEFNLNPTGNNTAVSYSFEGSPLPFLFRGFGLVTGMKKSMHTNYEESLENLKKLAEQRSSGLYDGYQINEEILDERHFVMNRQVVDMADIQQFYATNLGSLFGKVQTAGIEMSGMPCGLFFKFPDNGNKTDMAAAIPVSEAIAIEGAGAFSIESQKALVLDFYGAYDQTTRGHNAIDQYMKDRGYLSDPPVIEEYVTDPTTETDPNKWLTKMTYYYSQGQ